MSKPNMLFRFSLYGFLKNQTYFEPFLVLAFLEKGLSFTVIGVLIGVREVVTNLLEIPSGALADLCGRRRCMVISFLSYIVSFLILAFGTTLWHLVLGMVFFGGGEAFRSGTHKAMILDWLRAEGREGERTKVYGYTRSWSKIGSATSVLIASGLVYGSGTYANIFLFAIVPYVFNLLNLATYPAFLEGKSTTRVSFKDLVRHLWTTGRDIVKVPMLRRLMLESMANEGPFAAGKDYLQPLLKVAALSLPILLAVPDRQRTALVVGLVYFVLYVLSSVASRNAHRIQDVFGGEESAARNLWKTYVMVGLGLSAALYFQLHPLSILLFVVLFIAQNIWRPVLISRFDSHSLPAVGATLLSFESQAKSLATMVLAPLLGWSIDALNAGGADGFEDRFWPVGLVILVPAVIMVIWKGPAPLVQDASSKETVS